MAHANGIITAPINIETDIYAVLGIGPTSMGYDIGNACKSVKINPYAKYKPVIYPDMGPNCIKGQHFWYRSYNNLYSRGAQPCGIKVAVLKNGESQIKETNLNKGLKWNEGYVKPNGGDAEPFRSTDFDGYNHNEKLPFSCSYPTGRIEVGDAMTGDSLKSFFDCYFIADSRTVNHITIGDISTAFLHEPPSDSYGIVGFIAYPQNANSLWIKTKKVSASSPMQLVDLNISETKEKSFYDWATVSGRTTYLYPIICNKEIPLWSYVADGGNDLEVIMGPGEFSGWKKGLVFNKITVVPEVDYIITVYVYGSNFTKLFSPLENPIPFNGSSSEANLSVEILCSSERSHNAALNGTKPRITGYNLTSVHRIAVTGSDPTMDSSGGSWIDKEYNGKTRKAYRWNRVRIQGMYRASNGGDATGVGMVNGRWRTALYNVESSFYLYCSGQ